MLLYFTVFYTGDKIDVSAVESWTSVETSGCS